VEFVERGVGKPVVEPEEGEGLLPVLRAGLLRAKGEKKEDDEEENAHGSNIVIDLEMKQSYRGWRESSLNHNESNSPQLAAALQGDPPLFPSLLVGRGFFLLPFPIHREGAGGWVTCFSYPAASFWVANLIYIEYFSLNIIHQYIFNKFL